MDDESTVLHREVPDELHKLIRMIARGFYGVKHGLVIDVLVRNACVKEEDIQELLKFDKKDLRAMLTILKNDKLLKTKLCCIETEEGKVLRHNYYYINYRSICNVVKYKLHHILKKIETQERDLTSRAAFKCPLCQKPYTDLDVNQLVDPFTGALKCTFCDSEVEEVATNEEGSDSRTSQAKFNEQMDVIYKKLKEAENIRLSLEVLEPEPMIIPHLHPDAKQTAQRPRPTGGRQGGHWTDGKGTAMDYDQEVTINIGDEQPAERTVLKETPIWIQQSTIKGSDAASTAATKISGHKSEVRQERNSPSVSGDVTDNNEVFAMLLMQEGNSNSRPANAGPSGQHNDGHRSDASEGKDDQADEDEDDDDFEEVDDNDPPVMVAGKQYLYSEVARKGQSLVQLMTPEEKRAYIEVGQQMYDDMDH